MTRDVVAGTAMLKAHIEMTVSAAQRALKDALLNVYMEKADASPRRRTSRLR